MSDERTGLEMDFQELLAYEAQEQRFSLVGATLEAFKRGDTAAIKLVTQALMDSQESEDVKFPISDKRFEEIICFAADRIRARGK